MSPFDLLKNFNINSLKEKAEEIVQLFTLISNKAKEVVDRD